MRGIKEGEGEELTRELGEKKPFKPHAASSSGSVIWRAKVGEDLVFRAPQVFSVTVVFTD